MRLRKQEGLIGMLALRVKREVERAEGEARDEWGRCDPIDLLQASRGLDNRDHMRRAIPGDEPVRGVRQHVGRLHLRQHDPGATLLCAEAGQPVEILPQARDRVSVETDIAQAGG
jgi:hypothetical protein